MVSRLVKLFLNSFLMSQVIEIKLIQNITQSFASSRKSKIFKEGKRRSKLLACSWCVPHAGQGCGERLCWISAHAATTNCSPSPIGDL